MTECGVYRMIDANTRVMCFLWTSRDVVLLLQGCLFASHQCRRVKKFSMEIHHEAMRSLLPRVDPSNIEVREYEYAVASSRVVVFWISPYLFEFGAIFIYKAPSLRIDFSQSCISTGYVYQQPCILTWLCYAMNENARVSGEVSSWCIFKDFAIRMLFARNGTVPMLRP
jgi:hypothetical protein